MSNNFNRDFQQNNASGNSVITTDIIVIGSGLAGISAARKLYDAGQQVIVLEARKERIGGRIARSAVFDDLPIDLGASWLHSFSENPLFQYALKARVEMSLTKNPYLTAADNFLLYDSDGHLITMDEQQASREHYDRCFSAICDHIKTLPPDQDITAEEAFKVVENKIPPPTQQQQRQTQSTPLGPPSPSNTKVSQAIFEWLKSGIEGFENAKLSELSARSHFDQDKVFFEGEGFLRGFFRVLEHLARPLWDSGRIHLGQRVNCIDQSDCRSPVKVHTTTSTYCCQRVIVTVPLGVLKKGMIEFRPPLPSAKQAAIDILGFGIANKTFWEFDDVFWPAQCYGFGYMSGTSDRQFHVFINLMPLYGRPILFCPTVCATAEWVERSSDDDVVDAVIGTLAKVFGPEKVSRKSLRRYTITRWRSDEFCQGAYSFFAVGATEKHVEDVASPFERVLFAGEHTHEDPGYAHGAFLTGWREADRILNERGVHIPSDSHKRLPSTRDQSLPSLVTASKL